MDEKRWKDPGRFDPTRNVDDPLTEAESISQSNADLQDHFTFGAGRRNFPGVQIAHNSLFINITRILWAFDIRKPVDVNGNVIEPSTAAQLDFLLTLVEFACHFTPRNEQYIKVIKQVWADAQRD